MVDQYISGKLYMIEAGNLQLVTIWSKPVFGGFFVGTVPNRSIVIFLELYQNETKGTYFKILYGEIIGWCAQCLEEVNPDDYI